MLVTVLHAVSEEAGQLQYNSEQTGPETEGGAHTRPIWLVAFRWGNTHREVAAKGQLPGRSRSWAGNYTLPTRAAARARPRGGNRCRTGQALPLRSFPSCKRKTPINYWNTTFSNYNCDKCPERKKGSIRLFTLNLLLLTFKYFHIIKVTCVSCRKCRKT